MAREIETGERFGRLVALYKVPGTNPIKYHCLCDCGNYVDKDKYSLLRGKIKSCGCWKKEYSHNMVAKNLVGQRFGKLKVIKLASIKKQQQIWLCKCDCGNFTEVPTVYLTHGDTKSCGCWKKERMMKHGYSATKLYSVYQSIKQRCLNPKAQEYERYGGRGISICESWRNDFLAFRAWALSNGYKENEGLTIDRINNDGDYSPDNCRWATRKQQADNRSTNHYLRRGNEVHTIGQWAKILNVSLNTVYRKAKRGELCEVL